MNTPRAATPTAPSSAASFRRLGREYVKAQLVYNPLVVGVAVLGLGNRPYGFAFALGLTIAAVTSSLSFVPLVLAFALGLLRQRKGRAAAKHGRAWYFAAALLITPLGLYLAGMVTQLLFGVRVPASLGDYRYGIFLGTLIAFSIFALQTRAEARAAAVAAELRAERAERLELEAQLAALRAQLDPHLLFNALNTVAALLPKDSEVAERTLLRLAELYRGLLAASRCEQHTLERELEICRAYLDIERARFGDRLQASIEVAGLDPSVLLVPVLILQPLVDNAVSHGIAGRARGGTLKVRARASGDSLELEVEDDGVGLGNSSRRGAGLALETTRQRLGLRHGSAAALELEPVPSGGTRARLRLPRVPAPAGSEPPAMRADDPHRPEAARGTAAAVLPSTASRT